MLLGGVNFADMFVSLNGQSYESLEVAKAAAPVIAYESFINIITEFLIIALVLFFMIKTINRMKRQQHRLNLTLRIAHTARRAFPRRLYAAHIVLPV